MPSPMISEANRMLIGRQRLCYSGVYADSKKSRKFGAFTIYVAPTEHFDIVVDGIVWKEQRIAALHPFADHRIRTKSGRILKICIEPETIAACDIEALVVEAGDPDRSAALVDCLQEAYRKIGRTSGFSGFSSEEFDRFFFGRTFPTRRVDKRLMPVIDMLCDNVDEEVVSAEDCAAMSGLSVSRFLHIFKENTGVPFRLCRTWKRARRFLDYANRNGSLTHVALDLGYPDSSHFSRSIRRIFGLQPRSIREGLRELQVASGKDYTLWPRQYAEEMAAAN